MKIKSQKKKIKGINDYQLRMIAEQVGPSSIKRMQDFLISNNAAMGFKDIKKLARIEISGTAPGGRERLIAKELKDEFGREFVEEHNAFRNRFPPIYNGVIKYETMLGKHYTHFKVLNETDRFFDLELSEYRYEIYNTDKIFHLAYVVKIQGLNKQGPIYYENIQGRSVKDIFFSDELEKKRNDEFPEGEQNIIKYMIDSRIIPSEELDIIFSNTIVNIQVVNFYYEICRSKEYKNKIGNNTFFQNIYFNINANKWNVSQEAEKTNFVSQDNSHDNILKLIESRGNITNILDTNTIALVIKEILEQKKILSFFIAVGFVYESGLNVINEVLKTIPYPCVELVAGSLQYYENESSDNKIDKRTVQFLNELLKNKKIKLFTNPERFYHGKFYYLSNSEKAYIITGSSNISKTAFEKNYELDVLHIVEKNSPLDNMFLEWYGFLKEKCIQIYKLDESKFDDLEWNSELDVFYALSNHILTPKELIERIEKITDEEVKFRLSLWQNHNPTKVYEDTVVEAFKGYSLFVFRQIEIAVFESFTQSNAYYVFSCPKGEADLISRIKNMSKYEMRLSEHYIKRGNHIQDRENLKRKIDKYFGAE